MGEVVEPTLHVPPGGLGMAHKIRTGIEALAAMCEERVLVASAGAPPFSERRFLTALSPTPAHPWGTAAMCEERAFAAAPAAAPSSALW